MRSEGLRTRVFPVAREAGIDHNGTEALAWHVSGRSALTHGGEVEWANCGSNAERVADTVRVHILGDFDVLSLEKGWDGRQGVYHLQSAENISHSVRMGFALFERDIGCNFRLVLADQRLVSVMNMRSAL